MDPKAFGEASPGALHSIDDREWCFVPEPLPPNWEFPTRLWPRLADAKRVIGELEGVGSVVPNPTIFLRPLADREAIRSSSLEGTYATPKQLLLYELKPDEDGHVDGGDVREVLNYQRALHHGTTTELPLSLRLVRSLHRILMQGARGRDKTPGEFRKIQVAIGASRRFVPPSPEHVMTCLDLFEKYLHVEDSAYDPIVDCFLAHYQFETVHPFIDGNGRVGRLLLALMLQRKCLLSKPWLYMSEFFEKHRDEYTQLLFGVSAHGNWEAWIEFCLVGILEQSTDALLRCRRLLEVRERYTGLVNNVGGSTRLHQILERVFHTPFVRVADLTEVLGVTYPTAKNDVEKLVGAGILEELNGLYPKTFYAPDVYNIAYEKFEDLESATSSSRTSDSSPASETPR